jgi:hypothetical protein
VSGSSLERSGLTPVSPTSIVKPCPIRTPDPAAWVPFPRPHGSHAAPGSVCAFRECGCQGSPLALNQRSISKKHHERRG